MSIPVSAPTTTSTTTPNTTPQYPFKRALQIGSKGIDVKALQQFLNVNGYILSKNGAGSPGNETTTFGPATKAALIKFQKANKISPSVGYFGPITIGAVNTK
jgi:peptidoglycan hydrolase-like protein with peptidoglycan-binding domain